ncbi:MAG: protoporphyrinogen oxidase [Gammaproteobacteria bacterium]|nr:protoporphyrinogen oxidase [Gammaproteobacteria bacterium]
MSELDALVLGGGISGLSIAHCLAKSGLNVEVWESSERIGGKIQTVEKQGFRLENAASMVMNFRSELDKFLQQLQLNATKDLPAPGCRRYVLNEDKLHPVPTNISGLLKTPLFSTAGKLRLLAEPLIPRGQNPHESVADFIGRRLGPEFLEKVFEPYLAGPLASDIDLAEASSTIPRLTALEKNYARLSIGTLIKKLACRGSAARPQMFTFSGGMASLIQALASQGGFRLRNNLRASEIWPVRDGWMCRAVDGDTTRTSFARQLVVSTPADDAANLISGLDPSLARLLETIEYAALKVIHTGFNRRDVGHTLKGSGFLVPRRSGFSANGCLWMSSLFPSHAPEDQVLFSNYLGGARNPDAATWDEQRSLDHVMPMLKALLGVKKEPGMMHIKTHERGLPLYHGAYSQRLRAIDQKLDKLPGLYLEANYRGGVSVRDRILRAELVAHRVVEQVRRKKYESVSVPVFNPISAAISGVAR